MFDRHHPYLLRVKIPADAEDPKQHYYNPGKSQNPYTRVLHVTCTTRCPEAIHRIHLRDAVMLRGGRRNRVLTQSQQSYKQLALFPLNPSIRITRKRNFYWGKFPGGRSEEPPHDRASGPGPGAPEGRGPAVVPPSPWQRAGGRGRRAGLTSPGSPPRRTRADSSRPCGRYRPAANSGGSGGRGRAGRRERPGREEAGIGGLRRGRADPGAQHSPAAAVSLAHTRNRPPARCLGEDEASRPAASLPLGAAGQATGSSLA